MIHPLGKRPTIIGGAPLTEFVDWLNGAVGYAAGLDRLVVDQTGLAGNFDIEILFDPRVARPPAAIEPGLRNDVPDLRQALEDQLRLRLEERTMPMEVLVVDSVERPTPD
jgi:uncharacterized protein (TIGR03435 family)